jgi:hypothetical protein
MSISREKFFLVLKKYYQFEKEKVHSLIPCIKVQKRNKKESCEEFEEMEEQIGLQQ